MGESSNSGQCKKRALTERPDGPTPKRIAKETLFTEPGRYEDEITLLFDDGEKLFVSKMFLRHISDVFDTMFNANSVYKENEEETVKMVGKEFVAVRKLLYHLHPRIQQEIDRQNIFSIIPLAEEYMIKGSIKKCRRFLMELLIKSEDNRNGFGYATHLINHFQKLVIDILTIAGTYDYKEVRERARQVIVRWHCFGSNWVDLYNSIPPVDKIKILECRLRQTDGEDFVPANTEGQND